MFCLFKNKPVKPEFTGEITNDNVSTLLSDKFPNITIAISDTNYKICSLLNISDFIKTITIPNIKGGDCDDRAFILLAEVKKSSFNVIPFGFSWLDTGTSSHAVNIFIDDKKDLYVVEPQDGSIFLFPSNWKPYLVVL